MPYLNLDFDYFDNPKTRRLVGLLGRGAELLPLRLWTYCGRYFAETGRITGHVTSEIESLCGWWGQSGKAEEALIKVGFLEKDGVDHIVHDWLAHQGHIAAFKQRAKQAASKRWECYKHATSIAKPEIKQSPLPNQPSLPNQPESEEARTHAPDAEIPSLEEILKECDVRCHTQGSGKAFFEHHEGNNLWVNQYGKCINWRVKLGKWATEDRQRRKTENGNHRGNITAVSNERNKFICGSGAFNDNTPSRLPPGVEDAIRAELEEKRSKANGG